jgi:PRTRC genetic system protein B
MRETMELATMINHPAILGGPPAAPPFPTQGVLYFLDGQYLFCYPTQGGDVSKFVTARDLAAAFSRVEEDSGWLPAGVVRCGSSVRGRWFVYSAPAQKVEILIGNEPLTVPIPRTVFLAVGEHHYLWALRTKHFSPDATAYHAPFPNIYPNGMICWGRNKPPAVEVNGARQAWEAFFKTPFNQDLATNKSRSHDSAVDMLLRNLAAEGRRTYPDGDLVEAGGSIGKLIDNVIGGR